MDDWFHCNFFYHKIKTKVKNTIANRLNKVQSLWSYGANL